MYTLNIQHQNTRKKFKGVRTHINMENTYIYTRNLDDVKKYLKDTSSRRIS